MIPFFEEADVAVTICDREGRIIEMNEQSRQVNLKPGQSLIGKNVLDCHPEPARSLLADMMACLHHHKGRQEEAHLPDPVVRKWRVRWLYGAIDDHPPRNGTLRTSGATGEEGLAMSRRDRLKLYFLLIWWIALNL